jgi:hypothetical protein
LGVLLALALFNAFSRIPLDPAPGHLAPRYAASAAETHIASPFMAILGDYRGFDLLVLCVFLGVAGSVLSLLPKKPRPGLAFLLVTLGVGGALGLGWLESALGSNFLDHEALAHWVDPLAARWKGAFWLAWVVGLTFLGTILAWVRREDGEGSRGV